MKSFVVLYYQYVAIDDVDQFAKDQHELCLSCELNGRVRVSHEGINGTLSGSEEMVEKYMTEMIGDDRFHAIDWKTSWSDALPFPDLQIRIVNEIVSIELPEDLCKLENGGQHVSPSVFHQMIQEKDTVLIDVRNTYEYNIGHFQNALNPNTRRFGEFPDWVREHHEQLRDTEKVLMYCTGGIRCEKASSFVKTELGIDQVYQLQGGIHRYLEEYPDGGHFRGKNFVFDERVTQSSTDNTIVGSCKECAIPHDTLSGMRCAYCRMHILLCPICQESVILDRLYCPEHEYLNDPHSLLLKQKIEQLQIALSAQSGRKLKSKRKTLRKQLDYLLAKQLILH